MNEVLPYASILSNFGISSILLTSFGSAFFSHLPQASYFEYEVLSNIQTEHNLGDNETEEDVQAPEYCVPRGSVRL